MNTLTQQQINQYQWQVADGVARAIIPERIGIYPAEMGFKIWNEWADKNQYKTNAPDGIYSGEAFEEPRLRVYSNPRNGLKSWVEIEPDIIVNEGGIEQIMREAKANGLVACQISLRLKPSHLLAVLTTQPGEEWKDRYTCFIKQGNIEKECRTTNPTFLKDKSLLWILNDVTPPAEQEVETVEEAADTYANDVKPNSDGEYYHHLAIDNAFIAGAYWQLQQLQSTLPQKDQRIAELEREKEWISVDDRMPDDGRDVLTTYHFKHYEVANFYSTKEKRFVSQDSNSAVNATHWQEITPPQH